MVNDDRLGFDSPAVTVMSYYKVLDSSKDSLSEKKFEQVQGNIYIVVEEVVVAEEQAYKGISYNAIYEYNPRLPQLPNTTSIRKLARCKFRRNHGCTNFNGKLYIFGGNEGAGSSFNKTIEVFDPVTG